MRKNLLAISLTTMAALYGMLALVIILVFILLELPISFGILLSLIVLGIQFIVAPNINDWVFKHFYKTKFGYELPEYLQNFIIEVSEKYNMEIPKIGFIDDGSPNAFTYGRTKNDARIVVTRGILELLTEDEAKLVVAHELGHIVHHDMIFMTVAQAVPLVLYYVYQVLLERKQYSRKSDNDSTDYAAVVGMLAYILYIVSQYVILLLSRTREYYADAFAIEETENPTALARALVKIGFGLAVGNKQENSRISGANALGISDAKASKGVAIMAYSDGKVSKQSIVNAMKWEKWNIWAKLNEINSTHPLISNRLLAISNRCGEFGQETYIEFNEEREESYVDDFLKDLFMALLPYLSLTVFLVGMIMSAFEEKTIYFGGSLAVLAISLLLKLSYTHKNRDYKETNVEALLSEVKVSPVKSIPCILKGRIIGRGNPGCVFNEDFVLQDDTGIIFLDYNQPLYILEKIFAIFKSNEYFEKEVTVKGWYRRGTSPYLEVNSFTVDGEKTRKCHTYKTAKILSYLLLFVALIIIVVPFIAGE